MNNKHFIYFPSFSVGNVSQAMAKGLKMRNGMEMRFYSNTFPEQYRHPFFLVTAGHFYKKPKFIEEWGFTQNPDTLLLGDSGGFQIASGAIKWDPALPKIMMEWLENNSHIAMNLDIPPRLQYDGKFNECLEISKKNFEYFDKNRKGKTKFLNVLQGNNEITYYQWYNQVKGFEFDGWGIGGCGGSLYRFMSGIMALMQGKEQYNKNRKYCHILGTSKVIDFFILSQLQKSLNDIGSEMRVTTDSSTPSRAVVYGLYYHDVNFKNASFGSLHIPKERAENNKEVSNHTDSTLQGSESLLPNLIPFDDLLEGGYTYEDLRDWTIEGYAAVVLHNFMFFKDVMHKINSYVEGHPYFLEQVTNSDTFLLLKAVDEMVKAYENGTTPQKVFNKYKAHFVKMSTMMNSKDTIKHEFF